MYRGLRRIHQAGVSQHDFGEYNVVVGYVAPDNTIGGFQFVDVTVYREAVNADAKAAVLYDTNGDGEEEVVVDGGEDGE